MEIKKSLDFIEKKIGLLLEKVRVTRVENENLKEENQKLKEEVDSLKNALKELENKNVNLRIANSIKLNKENKEELNKRIDDFVNEIDRCIELLKG